MEIKFNKIKEKFNLEYQKLALKGFFFYVKVRTEAEGLCKKINSYL